MSDIISFQPQRAWDKNGKAVSGALATFFLSGTTTPVTVYSDIGETVPHPSPLVANSRGVFAPVYRGGIALRVVVTDPDGVVLPGYPIDPTITVSAVGSGASEVSFTPSAEIPETNVQAAIDYVASDVAALGAASALGVSANADFTVDTGDLATRGTIASYVGLQPSGSGFVATTGSGTISQEIPAGVNEITAFFRGITTVGATNSFLQFGVGGVLQATGYNSSRTTLFAGTADPSTLSVDNDTRVPLPSLSSNALQGMMRLRRAVDGANEWHYVLDYFQGSVTERGIIYGNITLSGELDTISLRNNSSNFNGGTVAYRWRN